MVPFAFILDLMFFAVFGYPIYRIVSVTLLSLYVYVQVATSTVNDCFSYI